MLFILLRSRIILNMDEQQGSLHPPTRMRLQAASPSPSPPSRLSRSVLMTCRFRHMKWPPGHAKVGSSGYGRKFPGI